MKTQQLEEIRIHGENLNVIFNTGINPVVLCKKLRRIEGAADKVAVDYCNGITSQEQYKTADKKILERLDKILNFKKQGIPVCTNGDPRGYILKIQESHVREHNLRIQTDWGGYGLIAPEIK